MVVKLSFQMWVQRNKNSEYFGKFLKEPYLCKEVCIKEVTTRNWMDIKQPLLNSISISLKKVTLFSSPPILLLETELFQYQTRLNSKLSLREKKCHLKLFVTFLLQVIMMQSFTSLTQQTWWNKRKDSISAIFFGFWKIKRCSRALLMCFEKDDISIN